MPKQKPPCETLFTWLATNLGRGALGALTGTDYRALTAAAHIIELYAYDGNDSILVAFAAVVQRMQASTREFAYHAIAHVLNWDDRARIWQLAGLPPIAARKCLGER